MFVFDKIVVLFFILLSYKVRVGVPLRDLFQRDTEALFNVLLAFLIVLLHHKQSLIGKLIVRKAHASLCKGFGRHHSVQLLFRLDYFAAKSSV